MKKLILILGLGLSLVSASAFAYDYGYDNRYAYVAPGRSGLDWRIGRLNRMLSHVRWEVSRYRGDWRLRREEERISAEVSRVNWRYRQGYETWQLRREIGSFPYQFHTTEIPLDAPHGDFHRRGLFYPPFFPQKGLFMF